MNAEETLKERIEELKTLHRKRFDFVLAYCELGSVEGALKRIGMGKTWYYKYHTAEKRQYLEGLADELHRESGLQAWYILQQAAPDAAKVKVEGLKSNQQWVAQAAASDILDRTTERRVQKSKVEVEGTVTHYIELVEDVLNRAYGDKPSGT